MKHYQARRLLYIMVYMFYHFSLQFYLKLEMLKKNCTENQEAYSVFSSFRYPFRI